MFAKSGLLTAPCGVPSSVSIRCPSSSTPAVSHLAINRIIRRSPSDVADQPVLVNLVEKRLNVAVEYSVDLPLPDPDTPPLIDHGRTVQVRMSFVANSSTGPPLSPPSYDHAEKKSDRQRM